MQMQKHTSVNDANGRRERQIEDKRVSPLTIRQYMWRKSIPKLNTTPPEFYAVNIR